MNDKLKNTIRSAGRKLAELYRRIAATPPEVLGGFARFQVVLAAVALGAHLVACAVFPGFFHFETVAAMALYLAVACGVVVADRHGIFDSRTYRRRN